MKQQRSYDYYLVLATAVVLFIISALCIWGMFSFKLAQIHQMDPTVKGEYMQRMNTIVSPFIIALIILVSICVPKRLLPVRWLNRFAAALIAIAIPLSLFSGIRNSLLFILIVSALLQSAVLLLALGGSNHLHFEKRGYWVRLGSSLIHLGLIMFVLDLFLHNYKYLHLFLFWITTTTVVMGMICSFYAEAVVRLVRGKTVD